MKKIVLASGVLAIAWSANAAVLPDGVTGLWRFQDSANKLKATIGFDLENSNPANAGWLVGPWTQIDPGWSDNGIIQDRSFDFLRVNPGFTANGGGDYVNEYTIAWDVKPDPGWNSLFQTAWDGNANDGDLWINAGVQTAATIGVGGTEGVGYSAATFDATKWHRIVLSVDNGSFFRVYVDGTLFLDAAGRPIDGRFSLYPDRFNLFADDNWEDAWILAGTVITWNRALNGPEITEMGGWIGDATMPTPLTFVPEPTALSLLVIGCLALLRRNRR